MIQGIYQKFGRLAAAVNKNHRTTPIAVVVVDEACATLIVPYGSACAELCLQVGMRVIWIILEYDMTHLNSILLYKRMNFRYLAGYG